VLQTPAGRMIFGRIEARPSGGYLPVPGPGTAGPTSATTIIPISAQPGTGTSPALVVPASRDTASSISAGTGQHAPVKRVGD
jgi:hypothetical protein